MGLLTFSLFVSFPLCFSLEVLPHHYSVVQLHQVQFTFFASILCSNKPMDIHSSCLISSSCTVFSFFENLLPYFLDKAFIAITCTVNTFFRPISKIILEKFQVIAKGCMENCFFVPDYAIKASISF